MEVFVTEEQQLEALRKWWKDNGMSVVIGAILGVAAIMGWKYWQSMQKSQAEQASDAYEEVLAIASDDSKSAELKQKAEALVQDYKGTVYAQFGRLFLARDAAKANDLPLASSLLEQVQKEASDKAIRHIATLRLARVKLAQGEAAVALELTQKDSKDAGDFKGSYALVRGLALLKLGREADAHAAFEEASQDKDMAAEYPPLSMLIDSSGSSAATGQ